MSAVRATGAMSAAAASTASDLALERLSVEVQSGGRALRVVDDVSLVVRRGETLGLVGESGSGKSTVANAILRVLPRRARARITGRIALGATELTALPEREMRAVRGRRIAMIPQDPMSSLNPLYTIGAQIAEALAAHGRGASRRARRAAVVELLERVRIDEPATRIDQYPHELSGGMRQRVVGAIAMASNPEFLLADEPTTALDVTVQAQYLDLLARLQRETGMGLLLITHDLGVVARVATHVAVMYAGRIVETGPVDTIFAAPRHWYTRALLDSVPGHAQEIARLAAIAGQPLRAGTILPGCRFAPRCPRAEDVCVQSEPALASVDARESRLGTEPAAPAPATSSQGRAAVPHAVRCHFPIGTEAAS